MERIILSAAERARVYDALPAWDRTTLRRSALEDEAARHGVAAVDAYVTLLHLDTLHVLGTTFPTVWKGGTAIQTLLPPDQQRISVDLDFNSTTGNVEILREHVAAVNARLEEAGQIVDIQGIRFGALYEADHRPEYRTIEFRRVLPSLFDDKVELPKETFPEQGGPVRIQGRLSRVQIDYGHHLLPALRPEQTAPAFFTQPAFTPRVPVETVRASIHDLVADKILATTRHDGFGRERFKDLYDLIALRHLDQTDPSLVVEKLDRIVGPGDARRIIESSMETLRILSVETASAQGFRNAACNEGKRWVRDWEAQVEATIAWLLEMAGQT